MLPHLSLGQMERLVAGEVDPVARQLGAAISEEWRSMAEPLLRIRIAQLRPEPELAPWILRAILLDEGERGEVRPVIGFINFHDAPRDRSWVELGYTILPGWRRRGFASEAVRGLMGWAQRQGIGRFRASISPGNGPSLGLVAKLGFGWTTEQWDPEDGLELIFERDGVP